MRGRGLRAHERSRLTVNCERHGVCTVHGYSEFSAMFSAHACTASRAERLRWALQPARVKARTGTTMLSVVRPFSLCCSPSDRGSGHVLPHLPHKLSRGSEGIFRSIRVSSARRRRYVRDKSSSFLFSFLFSSVFSRFHVNDWCGTRRSLRPSSLASACRPHGQRSCTVSRTDAPLAHPSPTPTSPRATRLTLPCTAHAAPRRQRSPHRQTAHMGRHTASSCKARAKN